MPTGSAAARGGLASSERDERLDFFLEISWEIYFFLEISWYFPEGSRHLPP